MLFIYFFFKKKREEKEKELTHHAELGRVNTTVVDAAHRHRSIGNK